MSKNDPHSSEAPERRLVEVNPGPKNKGILAYLTSTDHKQIGINYMVTSFIMFLIAGAMAVLMRVQLAVPNNNFVSLDDLQPALHDAWQHHAVLVPGPVRVRHRQLPGADTDRRSRHGLPRFNAFSYWLFLGGCITMISGFLTSSGAADWGWFAYAPLTEVDPLPWRRAATCGSWAWRWPPSPACSPAST